MPEVGETEGVKHTPRFGSNFGRPGGDVALATLDAKRFTSWSAPNEWRVRDMC